MTKKSKIILVVMIILSGFILLPQIALAEDECSVQGSEWLKKIGIKDGLLIPCGCVDECPDSVYDPTTNKRECNEKGSCNKCTDCGLTEVFQMVINFSNLILAFTGSAALLMFTIGGIMFIIAAGNQERVQKGKAVIQAAVIGLVVILGSWLLVNTTIGALTKGSVGGEIFTLFPDKDSQPWSQEPAVKLEE